MPVQTNEPAEQEPSNPPIKLHTNLAPVFHERGIMGNLGENIVKNVNRYLFM